jgi:hypothetical protein
MNRRHFATSLLAVFLFISCSKGYLQRHRRRRESLSSYLARAFQIGLQSPPNDGAGFLTAVAAKRLSIGDRAVTRLVNIDHKIEYSFGSDSCWRLFGTALPDAPQGTASDRSSTGRFKARPMAKSPDHLVGSAQHLRWDGQAKPLRRLQVYHKLRAQGCLNG